MSEWIEDALVLRTGIFRERDAWVKMLCKSQGMVTIFAFGAANSKKRFCGCLDVLNSLRCRIKSSRDGQYLNLQEAELLASPRKLRSDWRGMGLAANCLRFMEAMGASAESGAECLEIMEDLRESLEKAPARSNLSPIFFRLRAASALGYAPNLQACGNCGGLSGKTMHFLPGEGRVFCPDCLENLPLPQARLALEISASSLEALRFIQRSAPSEWVCLDLGPQEVRQCSRAIDAFVHRQLGLAWDRGFFRHI